MKRLLLLASFLFLLAQGDPCSAGTVGAILGRVVEQRTHEPFNGVRVEIRGTSIGTTTDENGTFELTNVPVGTYSLRVRIPEWGDFSKTVSVTDGVFTRIEIVTWPGITLDLPGMLAYYPMDGDASDIGPNRWSGANDGATKAVDRHGRDNAAMHFDGKKQRIVVGHQERLNQLPLSIAFWIKVESGVADPSVWLGKYLHPDGDGWCVFYEYQRLGTGYFRDFFATSARAHADFKADSTWHHVVVTMDTIGTVLFVDKARVPDVIKYPRKPTFTKNQEPLCIGYVNSKLGYTGLKGSIDDFYIFDHVLSDAEIETLRKD